MHSSTVYFTEENPSHSAMQEAPATYGNDGSFPGASGEESRELQGTMDLSAALVCDICKFSFERADDLEKHTSDHVAGKRHQCSVCGSLWRTPFLLERHLRIHNDEKPFKCSVCHVSFNRKDSLTRHLKKGHQIEQPFKCNACGRSYFSKAFLDRHIESCEKMNANATPE
ncbi:hypothetical protein HPB50_018428 [Hyalomma asiaticum]|uniref:Uncharacterized protein n=1 Tax=Hyalomma asiaticum TaxID=266040 RepID=A0ACB7T5R9_HYAAI|nr:hypothetical protein HPB50_018428 [Hyalomma asiaticum]